MLDDLIRQKWIEWDKRREDYIKNMPSSFKKKPVLRKNCELYFRGNSSPGNGGCAPYNRF